MMRTQHIITALLVLTTLGFSPSTTSMLTGISATVSLSAEELVRDHFIKGNCRNVSNIDFFGDASSLGFFNNGENIIGLPSGIVISTGQAVDIAGPNSSIETSTSFNNNSGDPDLDIFASNVVLDATGIEFDFVPTDSQVTFQYVFASEEYCEFVGSIFNDNFGFFVSGPGLSGEFFDAAVNVATLPITGEYVAINSINHSRNEDFYVRNELERDARSCNIDFNPNHIDLIEFDGFTLPLIATINVIPCKTYHIRLAVGDVGDDKLDSAVFLASKSFNLGEEVTIRAEVDGSMDPIAVENCRDGRFVFERTSNLNIDQPKVVNFNISSISDATPDVDYVSIPNTITIPAFSNSFELPITVLADQLDELPERIRLEIEYDCECLNPVETDLIIDDLDSLQGSFEETFVCPGQEFSLGPTVTGGAAPYSYLWNTNATTSDLTATVSEPTHFTVTITDACGGTAPAIVAVNIQQPPPAVLMETIEYCEGETAFLTVNLSGHPPWSFSYSINGVPQPAFFNITQTPFRLPVRSTGEYKLLHFEDAYCTGEVEGIGIVNAGGPTYEVDVNSPSCATAQDGSIAITITEGLMPYQLEWDFETVDPFNPTGLAAGTYQLSITDGNACLNSTEIEVPSPTNSDPNCQNFLLYVPNVFSPNDDGRNDVFQLHTGPNSFIKTIESIQIFNRWGALIVERTNLTPAEKVPIWDGYYKGEKMDAGVFVWTVRLALEDGTIENVSGDVTLID